MISTIPDISLVITAKNRKDHFLKTFASVVTQQQPQKYEIIYVDFDSNDGFKEYLADSVLSYESLFSDSLLRIKRISLEFSCPFNSGKAKNLGSYYSRSKWLSFSDIDVFLGMSYHRHWSSILEECDNSFFSSRVQETTEKRSCRVSPTTNYGNMIVSRENFNIVGGFDEENSTWGGDDDDIIHRLKLCGLREINPHSQYESNHITILHGDEDRVTYLESQDKSRKISEEKFKKIYENSNSINSNFLSFYEKYKDKISEENVYEVKSK